MGGCGKEVCNEWGVIAGMFMGNADRLRLVRFQMILGELDG